MVEMALVLPVFLLLLSGIIEFGRAFMISQLVLNGAREGSRMAALGDSTEAEVETFVEGYLASSLGMTGSEITVTSTAILPDGTAANSLAAAGSGSTIYVDVSVPFSSVSLLNTGWLDNKNITSKQAMRKF